MNFQTKIQIAKLAKIKLLFSVFDRKLETKGQFLAYLLVVASIYILLIFLLYYYHN